MKTEQIPFSRKATAFLILAGVLAGAIVQHSLIAPLVSSVKQPEDAGLRPRAPSAELSSQADETKSVPPRVTPDRSAENESAAANSASCQPTGNLSERTSASPQETPASKHPQSTRTACEDAIIERHLAIADELVDR